MKVRVRVPGSTSNLGPGFDCLGMAVDLHCTLEVGSGGGRGLEVRVTGLDTERIPRGVDNLILAGLCQALGCAMHDLPPLRVELHNEIPVGRGLGSSGAAIVAGLVAGRLLSGEPLEPAALLTAAAALEGHPDNVAPALMGGLVASALTASGGVHAVPFPLPPDLELVLVIPERGISTPAARALLPAQVPFADAVHNLAHTALLLGALGRSDWDLLRPAVQDRLHHGRRLRLLPGLEDALAALDAEPGCAAAVLSGSGPTLLGFVRAGAPVTGRGAAEVLARHGIASEVRRVRPQRAGASWEHLER